MSYACFADVRWRKWGNRYRNACRDGSWLNGSVALRWSVTLDFQSSSLSWNLLSNEVSDVLTYLNYRCRQSHCHHTVSLNAGNPGNLVGFLNPPGNHVDLLEFWVNSDVTTFCCLNLSSSWVNVQCENLLEIWPEIFLGNPRNLLGIRWARLIDTASSLPPPKEVMLLLRSVCLFVDNWKSCERIFMKFLGGVGHSLGTKWLNLVTIWINVRIQESEVRNPYSLDYRKSIHSGLRSKLHSSVNLHCKNYSAILLCWRSVEVCALWVHLFVIVIIIFILVCEM